MPSKKASFLSSGVFSKCLLREGHGSVRFLRWGGGSYPRSLSNLFFYFIEI